jgi:hypothetical protein
LKEIDQQDFWAENKVASPRREVDRAKYGGITLAEKLEKALGAHVLESE